MGRVARAAVGLAVGLAALSGCDVIQSSCDVCFVPAFDERAAVTAPDAVVAGEPFEAVVSARPRVSGVGTVRIVAQVGLLRALAPVADTVNLASGTRATTRPARVAFTAGQRLSVAWTLAADQAAPFLNPGIGAVVALDSVRLADGRLVAVDSPEAFGAFGPDGLVAESYAEPRLIRLVRPAAAPRRRRGRTE